MIYLYSGCPGSGKSLHQAQDAYNWLRVGKPLIANYNLNTDLIKPLPFFGRKEIQFTFLDNAALSPCALIDYSGKWFSAHRFYEGAIRLYIDEAQLLFNCREWNAKKRAEWIGFFTQHRKYGYDIFLIAQFDRMLDRQLRSLIEYEYIHRKVSNFGWKGKLLSAAAFGNLFVSVKIWYPLNEKIGAEFFRYKKCYAAMYDSYKVYST